MTHIHPCYITYTVTHIHPCYITYTVTHIHPCYITYTVTHIHPCYITYTATHIHPCYITYTVTHIHPCYITYTVTHIHPCYITLYSVPKHVQRGRNSCIRSVSYMLHVARHGGYNEALADVATRSLTTNNITILVKSRGNTSLTPLLPWQPLGMRNNTCVCV